jgi:DNA-directed RNA polymerase specialized sigma24 family protein
MSHKGFPFCLIGKKDQMAKETCTDETDFERLIVLAKEGQRNALEDLVRRIQDRIYGLALRTLFLPADAEDATQEILIKIITHLEVSKGKPIHNLVFSSCRQSLLSTHKRRAERRFSFEGARRRSRNHYRVKHGNLDSRS